MIKFMFLTAVLFLAVGTSTVYAGDCNNGNFHGSYTRVDAPSDVYGDGSVIHQYVFNLILGVDGSAKQYWTGLPDLQINAGTGSPSFGSWKCRADGKLVVTLITATYSPIDPNANLLYADVTLTSYSRATLLFNVNNQNKLTRIQSRSRSYAASQNPADPAGGTLGAINNTQFIYDRVVASDADLLAP